jgi:hypothetical protein
VSGQQHGPAVLYPRERPGTYCTGSWVGPRAGLDSCGNLAPNEIRSPYRPARKQSLYRLSYGLDGTGIESRWGSETFHTLPDRLWGSPSLRYIEYRVPCFSSAPEKCRRHTVLFVFKMHLIVPSTPISPKLSLFCRFSYENSYMNFSSLSYVSCSTFLSLLDFITLLILGEQNKS